MSSQTIATFTPADVRIVESFRRKFPRTADNMLRLAVVKMARDALYDSTSKVLAERVAVLEKENAELDKSETQLEAELATIYTKYGDNFERAKLITGVQLITQDDPPECDRCKHNLPNDCKLPGDECEFEAVGPLEGSRQ